MYISWYFLDHCRVMIEANQASTHAGQGKIGRLTFEELLACIFLEECFVANRTVNIIDH